MIRLRDLFLLLVVAVMCTGGSFTCRSGDIDEDDPAGADADPHRPLKVGWQLSCPLVVR